MSNAAVTNRTELVGTLRRMTRQAVMIMTIAGISLEAAAETERSLSPVAPLTSVEELAVDHQAGITPVVASPVDEVATNQQATLSYRASPTVAVEQVAVNRLATVSPVHSWSDSVAAYDRIETRRLEMRLTDRRRLQIVSALLVASTILDVESTFRALSVCDGCREGNPLLAPMVESGRLATYATTLSIDALLIWQAHRAQRNGSRWWWVMPMFSVGAHGTAAGFNIKLSM